MRKVFYSVLQIFASWASILPEARLSITGASVAPLKRWDLMHPHFKISVDAWHRPFESMMQSAAGLIKAADVATVYYCSVFFIAGNYFDDQVGIDILRAQRRSESLSALAIFVGANCHCYWQFLIE